MKKITYFIIIMCLFAGCSSNPVSSLENWLAKPVSERGNIEEKKFAKQALSKQDSEKAIELLKAEWLKQVKEKNASAWEEKVFTKDSLKMKFDYKIFGDEPADGRSLFISMHGGGNTSDRMNDGQWRNQVRLYSPKEGVYLAPRAPWNDWNMWFKEGLDALFDAVISTAVVMENVNPDKVYIMGYSAGGDGAYRIGPRMADRWAAGAMMAGHPGEVSMVNLRNTPYCIWMGADDAAYGRNELAAVFGAQLDSLQKDDPKGYIHETHILEGKGHWMQREDSVAVEWMAQFKRNPKPDKIVWRQEHVTLPNLYWLSVPVESAKPAMEVRVNRSDNTVNILRNDYDHLTIHLNDEMFDLDNPIIIKYNDNELFNGKVERKISNISKSLSTKGDIRYIFPAQLTVINNESIE